MQQKMLAHSFLKLQFLYSFSAKGKFENHLIAQIDCRLDKNSNYEILEDQEEEPKDNEWRMDRDDVEDQENENNQKKGNRVENFVSVENELLTTFLSHSSSAPDIYMTG